MSIHQYRMIGVNEMGDTRAATVMQGLRLKRKPVLARFHLGLDPFFEVPEQKRSTEKNLLKVIGPFPSSQEITSVFFQHKKDVDRQEHRPFFYVRNHIEYLDRIRTIVAAKLLKQVVIDI